MVDILLVGSNCPGRSTLISRNQNVVGSKNAKIIAVLELAPNLLIHLDSFEVPLWTRT
jgi:hypothetical protein